MDYWHIASTEKKKMYDALMAELTRQIHLLRDRSIIEIITEEDNGENSVGKKRNNVLDRAAGEYVCFIDDDDMVTDIYVSEIVNALS